MQEEVSWQKKEKTMAEESKDGPPAGDDNGEGDDGFRVISHEYDHDFDVGINVMSQESYLAEVQSLRAALATKFPVLCALEDHGELARALRPVHIVAYIHYLKDIGNSHLTIEGKKRKLQTWLGTNLNCKKGDAWNEKTLTGIPTCCRIVQNALAKIGAIQGNTRGSTSTAGHSGGAAATEFPDEVLGEVLQCMWERIHEAAGSSEHLLLAVTDLYLSLGCNYFGRRTKGVLDFRLGSLLWSEDANTLLLTPGWRRSECDQVPGYQKNNIDRSIRWSHRFFGAKDS